MNGINVLQVNRIGFNASFKIVLAIGKDFPPIGYNTNKGINISDTCIDFDDLSQGPKVFQYYRSCLTNFILYLFLKFSAQ